MQGLQETVQGHATEGQILQGVPRHEVVGSAMREATVMEQYTQPDVSELLRVLDEKGILDDRDRIVAAYRVGAKGKVLTLQELGNYFQITRERVRQIENRVKDAIGEAEWDRLCGIYRPPAPIYGNKRTLAAYKARLREYFANMPENAPPIQFKAVMDKLGIPYQDVPNDALMGEEETVKTIYEMFKPNPITNFGRLKVCSKCEEPKPISDDQDKSAFYKASDAERYYGICKSCNSQRCADYMRKRRQGGNG